jgi:hypothetical protein
MATLHGVTRDAETAGYEDGRYGRLYRDSFSAYFKGLGLASAYEQGWIRGRKVLLDKR